MEQRGSTIEVFCCYAHEDEYLLDELKTHLSPLQRQQLVKIWHDRDISAGTEWEQEIEKHLNEAHIILLLISPDFISSEYCYGTEMRRALELHKRGEARAIPVILRPVDGWEKVPSEGIQLGQLQALPKDAKPITSWTDHDEAWKEVTEGISRVANELTKTPSNRQKQMALDKVEKLVPRGDLSLYQDTSGKPTFINRKSFFTNHLLWLLFIAIFVVISSSFAAFFFSRSSSRNTRGQMSTPTSLVTSSSTSTPTPIPTSPIASTRGSKATYFGGYIVSGSGLTGLKAQWNVPHVTDTGVPDEQVSIGMNVGCGSSNSSDCLRLFIYILFSSNTSANIRATYWSAQIGADLALTVSPGDIIVATMESVSNARPWILQMTDQTQGGPPAQASFGYPLSRVYAGFYVGTTYDQPHNREFPLPNFEPVTFQNVELRYDAGWVGISTLAYNSVDMIQENTTFLQASSPLNGDSFTVKRLNPQDQPTTV